MVVAQHKVNEESTVWQRKETLPMDNYEFRQWTELLSKRAGLFLPDKRKTFLITNLNIRMRELKVNSYRDYFNYLVTGRRGAVEWEILIDRLTVHETRFYRDENALEMLRLRYIPEALATTGTIKINAWSVGCATGEEPYSLAMLLDYELLKNQRDYYLSITATDISSAALSTGRVGIYHDNRLKNLPEHYRRMYCKSVDDSHSQVVKKLRERVCFSRLNLLNLEKTNFGQMDIIFCQNVLIYFQREQRLRFINLLVERLRQGGILVLGAGEITDWNHPSLESINYPGVLAFRHTGKSGVGE